MDEGMSAVKSDQDYRIRTMKYEMEKLSPKPGDYIVLTIARPGGMVIPGVKEGVENVIEALRNSLPSGVGGLVVPEGDTVSALQKVGRVIVKSSLERLRVEIASMRLMRYRHNGEEEVIDILDRKTVLRAIDDAIKEEAVDD